MSRLAALLLVGVATIAAGCGIVRLGAPGGVDLNSADARTIAGLPGLTAEDALRIVASRPYTSKEDLLRRNLVDRREYAAIDDLVHVGPPGMPDYLRSVPPLPQGP